jgi:hypothetical protein
MGRHNYGAGVTMPGGQRLAAPVATLADLKAMGPSAVAPGMTALVGADGKRWRYHSTSALTGDDLLVAAPANSGAGRWLLAPGAVDIAIPITFATADAAILLTVPAGCRFKLEDLYWEVTANFTGGASSAIGVSSSNKAAPTAWTTKGDLLGGATGDVAATLVAATGIVTGTVGTDMDTIVKRRGAIWKATETFRFDRITSAFTAGTGFVHLVGTVLTNNGA